MFKKTVKFLSMATFGASIMLPAVLNAQESKPANSEATKQAEEKPAIPKPADYDINGPALDESKDYVAEMVTSKGTIKIKLFPESAPETVRNFVNLSEGTKPYKNARTGRTVTDKPYYDGIVFHRIIKGFMIQGGDPTGTGRGGPGYQFKDEFDPKLRFDRMDYVLAMANAGPGTNGSQFFITDKGSRPAHLNNRHTIFGQVIEGQEVVDAIASSANGESVIETVNIILNDKEVAMDEADMKEKEMKERTDAILKAHDAVPKEKPASKPTSQPSTDKAY